MTSAYSTCLTIKSIKLPPPLKKRRQDALLPILDELQDRVMKVNEHLSEQRGKRRSRAEESTRRADRVRYSRGVE